jgi:hypothetical protein
MIPASSPAMFSLFIISQLGVKGAEYSDAVYKLTVSPFLQSRHSRPRRSAAHAIFRSGLPEAPPPFRRIRGPHRAATIKCSSVTFWTDRSRRCPDFFQLAVHIKGSSLEGCAALRFSRDSLGRAHAREPHRNESGRADFSSSHFMEWRCVLGSSVSSAGTVAQTAGGKNATRCRELY